VYYQIGIKALDPADGSYVPAYANTYYDVAGTVEVKHDLYPTLIPSQQVLACQFQTFFNADQTARAWNYYSGNLYASPQFKSNTALQTVAVYMTNYKGTVVIEGTLENNPNTFGNYAVISSKSYNGFSGIDYTNFNGLFSYIRVRYIPAINPVTQSNNIYNNTFAAQNLAYAGSVDQILYRS